LFTRVLALPWQDIKNPPQRMTEEDRRLLERFSDMYDKAEVYYAYSFVHRNVASPFRTIHSSMLFNMCRFLLMRTLNVSLHA
jgi:intraflagellar transport protein 122